MFGAVDDFVLHTFMQSDEEGAEAGHTHQEIFMILRMNLCILEFFGADAVELNVITAKIYERFHKVDYRIGTLWGVELVLNDAHIEMSGVEGWCILRQSGIADEDGNAFLIGADGQRGCRR